MSLLGNVLWFLLGGIITGLLWWFFGIIAFISIIGIPWGKACFVIGTFAFFPFGKTAIRRDTLTGEQDIGTGAFGLIGNIIWFLLAGLWIGIGHVAAAIACAITIIGIPFAWQHLKLAGLTLCPIGMTIVPIEVSHIAQAEHAKRVYDKMQKK